MSLFSSSLISNRNSTAISLLGADGDSFKEGLNKELGLTRFQKTAEASLMVAQDPVAQLKAFKNVVALKESSWLARYKDINEQYNELGYTTEESHKEAIAAAKQLAEEDIKLSSRFFPYILDDDALVSFKAGFQVGGKPKADK